MRRLLLATAAAVIALAAPAPAIVPPKDCGRIRVSGKRYDVKADQLRCRRAVRYTRTYLRSRHKPRHYTCHRYSGSALIFRCTNSRADPDRTFFAIRR